MKIPQKLFFFILISSVCIWISSNISWGKNNWKGILESDARGYYAYLPATFIYKDFNFGFFDSIEGKKYFDKNFYYDYRVVANEKIINKYWCGTSICELPFFLLSHIFTFFTNGDTDGYSKLYPILINCAAIFYLMIGLIYLEKLLVLFSIDEKKRWMTLGLVFFATNLFYYTIIEPGMSHVYSFALICIFIYHFKKFVLQPNTKSLYFLSASLGLIFLIRPANLMILFALPFVAGSKNDFIATFKFIVREKVKFTAAVLLFTSICSIQFVIYKISTGYFFIDSYPGEKFNFLHPHIFDILFSYKKGLFLYTPFFLLCFGGIFIIYKNSKWQAFSIFIFLFLITYILSCWHNWWYGGSFSSRVYVEYLPVFAILFAVLIQNISSKMRKFILAISIILLLLCQVQIYQYRYNQITWDSMTKEKYWNVFLRLDKII
ncbi:MAG: hypothetical protein ACK452_16670 [Bacteroidota bacterium]